MDFVGFSAHVSKISNVSNGVNVVGPEAIGQSFGEGIATTGGTQSSTTDEIRIEGDIAYALGSWSITGGNGPDIDGEWLWVLTRQSDGRLLTYGIYHAKLYGTHKPYT